MPYGLVDGPVLKGGTSVERFAEQLSQLGIESARKYFYTLPYDYLHKL